jgi:uncharacterized membrane protein
VDALRGLAVVLMVVNHTARWWLSPAAGAARDPLIYTTMVLAGPTFLLLVGFSLALAYHAATRTAPRPLAAVAAVTVRRAAVILAGAFLLNALAFGHDVLGARVLHSIALALLVATPLLPLVRSPRTRPALLAAAVALYAAFPPAIPALAGWSRAHPVAAGLLLREFPLFPWLGLVLVGLVLGWAEASGREAGGRRPRDGLVAGLGLAGLAAYWLGDPRTPIVQRLAFEQDLTLNDYWTAGPLTAVGMMGALLCLLAGASWAVERHRWPVTGLVWLGRAALLLYVVHLVLILPLGRDAWSLAFQDWWTYGLATALLVAALVALAAVWLRVRPRLGRRLPVLRPA